MNWFIRKGFLQGAFWALMIHIPSTANDVLAKYAGSNLHPLEISFFRFFFSTLVILPWMLSSKKNLFKTQQIGSHFIRALIGCMALGACIFSVNYMPLQENSTIMFTDALFTLLLASLILKEVVDTKRWICTILGFIGLIIVLAPGSGTFQWMAFAPVIAAILFAFSNIISKTMVDQKENTFTLLFYFGLGATLLALIPLPWIWSTPSLKDLLILAGIGIGANLIQVFMFRAFSSTDASSLTPFRYVEFLTASLAGYAFFGQPMEYRILLGCAIIVLSTFLISFFEQKKSQVVIEAEEFKKAA